MQVSQLVFESEFFSSGQKDINAVMQIQRIITNYMRSQGYLRHSNGAALVSNQIFTMDFFINTAVLSKPPKKSFFSFFAKKEDYFFNLRTLTSDTPYKVSFHIKPHYLNDTAGYRIVIRSESTAYWRIKQLSEKWVIDELEYGIIEETNNFFLNGIISELCGIIIREPKANFKKHVSQTTMYLEQKGFLETSRLLVKSKQKLDASETTEALTYLRRALDDFFKVLFQKLDLSLTESLKKNVETLQSEKRVNSKIASILTKLNRDWLSKAAHKDKDYGILECKYILQLVESLISYLLDKPFL